MSTCAAGSRCGTYTGYARWRGRCDSCRAAVRRYDNLRIIRRLRGDTAYVDATPAREHLLALADLGEAEGLQATRAGALWFFAPAKEIGLSATQLRRIMAGDIKRVWPSTVDKILSLSLDDHDTSSEMRDRESFDWLVSALLDKGWTKGAIARAVTDLGASRADAVTPKMLQQHRPKVRRVRLDAMRVLLTADRPPAEYVAPPFGGWDAWWNLRPAHTGRRHHTRRGCWRRGCRNVECCDANRIYTAALAGADPEPLTKWAEQAHRVRERNRISTAALRSRAA